MFFFLKHGVYVSSVQVLSGVTLVSGVAVKYSLHRSNKTTLHQK